MGKHSRRQRQKERERKVREQKEEAKGAMMEPVAPISSAEPSADSKPVTPKPVTPPCEPAAQPKEKAEKEHWLKKNAIAMCAAVVALISLYQTAKINQQFVEPKISCKMRLIGGLDLSATNAPSKVTRTGTAKGPSNAVMNYSVTETRPSLLPGREMHLVILNEGPVKAVSLSVLHKIHYFWETDGLYAFTVVDYFPPYDAILFKEELPVGFDRAIDYIVPSHIIPNIKEGNAVGVHVFDLTYYREKDSKRFTQRELFLVEQDNVVTQSDLRRHRLYEPIVRNIEWLDRAQSARTNASPRIQP